MAVFSSQLVMPRSSRSKSHKQSKHSVKETVAAKEYTDSEEDVVKTKERNGKEDSSASVRVSRDSASGEKRKFPSSQSKDGKDLSGHGNGDASEDYVASKRRKEKESDRWNGGGDEKGEGVNVEKELDKVLKAKDSKSSVLEAKSKSSSRRHESGSEKKEESVSVVVEKEESKSGGKSESKRKGEKDSGRKEGHQYKDSKELKEKDRGSDRERKVQDGKRDAEARAVDGEVARKHGEDQQTKRGRENTEWPVDDGLRNPELEKELEKRIRRRGEGSGEKDKYQDDARESDDKCVSVRVDRSKDARQKEESYADKYKEDGDRENRHREDKYREDGERDIRHRDVKYREDGEKDNRHKDDKYREDGDRDNRHREDKYREDGNRDNRHKEDKYREDGDRDSRRRDDKFREGGERDDRNRDDKYREEGDRDYRRKEEKHREDVDRDSRHRDGRPRDDVDREKRVRDAKYKDVHTSRDRPSDSENKRFKEDSNASDMYYRKSSNRDASPIYDDRVKGYKDDKDKRRGNDKEDPSDFRSRSTKEQRSDAEKRSMGSAKVDSSTDRGRPNSRNADLEVVGNHSRRRSSPGSSSYAARDHYRVSKQEETKYRDYAYEERVRHNVTSSRDFASTPGQTEKLASSRSLEKNFQKDDSHLAELSIERRPRSDARASPLQLMDKSPSSTRNDRRNLNRSDVRRSLDAEEPGQRSSGSKDARDYSSKGIRELPIENPPVDEFSQADGDNLSVSSPYTRASHFSGNSKSLLPPPPPFRSGPDSPSVFGSAEDDNRGKPNNRHRRMGDSNVGRPQNAWKGVPNWPSPMSNGYIPFQHGPPPFGVHPVMQQFPPPIFGVRPTMDLSHNGVPYHIPDGDRFSSHGRPHGWRNPVDDSIPPPLHGWDANNAVFGDEHIFGRLDWDRNRTPMGNRGWETSSDMWKGQNSGTSMDMPSAPQKEDYSTRRPADENWTSQSGQLDEIEQNQLDLQAESINISQSSDALDRKTPEAPKTTVESPHIYETSKEEESRVCQIYLSKVDISADLTQPELYSQCSDMMDFDQTTMSGELDCKILYIEDSIEARGKIPNRTPSAALFAAINDSVFQKAMSLYKKQKDEYGALNGEKVSISNVDGLEFDQEKAGSDDGQHGDEAKGSEDGKSLEKAEGAITDCTEEKAEQTVTSAEKPETTLSIDTPMSDETIATDSLLKLEEPLSVLEKVEMEVEPAPMKNEPDSVVEEKSSAMETVEQSGACLPSIYEEVNESCETRGNANDSSEEHIKLVETKCDGDMPTEAMMLESIECGSVNLSRIHHSPESTH